MNQHFYFIWLLSFCCGASLANGFHPRISLSIAGEMVPVESFRNCFVPSEDQRSCLDWPMNPVGPPGPQNSSDTLLSLVDINQGLVTNSHSISDLPLSQVDLNQGLDTKPANNPDALSSPVDVNKSLNTESRASEEDSNASQKETSAQQVQQVPQYVPEDHVSTEDGKDERHVSFNLDNPSTIGAQISTQNEPPKLPDIPQM